MRNIKKILLLSFAAVSFSVLSETESRVADVEPSIQYKSPPMQLTNYITGKKVVINDPDNITSEEAKSFIPPLPESAPIFDLYIEQGYSIINSIQYTHEDILEIYSKYLDKNN